MKMIRGKNKKITKLMISTIAIIVVLVAMLSGCIDNKKDEKTITIKGSSTVLPVATLCAEEYMNKHDNVRIIVSGGGSSLGIKSVGTGDADIGDASREIKQSEIDAYPDVNFVDHKIALDGVAVIVSKEIYNSGVTDISLEQLKAIYNGTINNWNILGGPDEEIFVNEREEGSGTRDTFMELVDLEETNADIAHSANSQVKQAVSNSQVGIGYVGLGYVDEDTPALSIDNVSPTSETIQLGTYPISRSLHMYTNGEPSGEVKKFLDFIMGPEGQAIVEEEGFIPIN